MLNWEGIFSNQELGMRVYIRIVMIMVLECKRGHIKNLAVKSTLFPHRNFHKYTWNSLDEKTHNKIDHILIDMR